MQRSRKRKLRSTTHMRILRRSVPVASGLIMAISAAYAQDRAQVGALPEIVVTAQKRSERLQDVPISVQAFETAKLEELHIKDFEDYAKFLPNVSFQSFGPGFARVFMRGVTSGDLGNHSGPLPSVGVYLDEQPVTTVQGSLDVHLYDIARIEALAGPQGTLYGASSQAGTLRIITNKPDTSGFAAGYDVEANTISEGDAGYIAEGFINVPLSDAMAVRLVGWYRHDGGYIDNVAGSRTFPNLEAATGDGSVNNAAFVDDDYNDVDTVGARAALKIILNENWTMTPVLMFQNQDADGFFAYQPQAPGGRFQYANSAGDLKVSHYYPEKATDDWYQAALTVEGKIGNFDVVYAGAYMDRDSIVDSDYADYSFFYDVAYQLPNACCNYQDYFFNDDGDPINSSNYIRGQDLYTKESHELRISSPQDWRVRFVAGLFYQKQQHDIEQRYMIDDLATSLEVTGWDDTWWLTEQRREDEDRAIFGEVTVDITEKLAATGGMRLFRSDNSLVGFFGFGATNDWTGATGEKSCDVPAPPGGGGSVNGGPCTNLDRSLDDTDETYKANLTYKFTPDIMVYATYSTGYRPAGVNRRLGQTDYRADYLDNYEIGWKTTLADGRIRFNGAAFWQKWDDFQTSFLGQNGLPQVSNAPNGAQIPGIETTLEWAATDALTLSAGAMWLDPELSGDYCEKLTDDDDEPLTTERCQTEFPGSFAPDGTTLPITPDFKANLIGRYDFPIGSLNASLQGSVVYQSDSRSALLPGDEAILGSQDSFAQADFSASIGGDSWTVELFIDNAFDERADLFRFTQCDEGICGAGVDGADPTPPAGDNSYVGNVYVGTIQPRTIGLRFGQKF